MKAEAADGCQKSGYLAPTGLWSRSALLPLSKECPANYLPAGRHNLFLILDWAFRRPDNSGPALIAVQFLLDPDRPRTR